MPSRAGEDDPDNVFDLVVVLLDVEHHELDQHLAVEQLLHEHDAEQLDHEHDAEQLDHEHQHDCNLDLRFGYYSWGRHWGDRPQRQ
jgi:hypothetical protein